MTTVAFLSLAVGAMLILVSVLTSLGPQQGFARPGMPGARTRQLTRMLPVGLGAFLTIAAVVVLILFPSSGP